MKPMIIFFLLGGLSLFALGETENSLDAGVEKLEQALTRSGAPKLSKEYVTVGLDKTRVQDLHFGRIRIINNDKPIESFIKNNEEKGINASIYVINPNNKNELIPISTTALNFKGAKQLGTRSALAMNMGLQKIFNNKEKVCEKEVHIPTRGVEFNSRANNFNVIQMKRRDLKLAQNSNGEKIEGEIKRLLDEIKELEENPSRCQVNYDYCAKPILSDSKQVIGVYLLQKKSINNTECSKLRYKISSGPVFGQDTIEVNANEGKP